MEKEENIFKRMSNLITAKDIMSKIAGVIDVNESNYDFLGLVVEESIEMDINPIDTIVVFTKEDRIYGYLGLEDYCEDNWDSDNLESKIRLIDLINPISETNIIPSYTTLFDIINYFYETESNFFIVSHEENYVGCIYESDLKSTELQMCILAMILNIEALILKVLKINPIQSSEKLKGKPLDNCTKEYGRKKYPKNKNENYNPDLLLNCTTLSNRFYLLEEYFDGEKIQSLNPKSNYKNNIELTKSFRNGIVHPASENEIFYSMTLKDLYHYTNWLSNFELELKKYIEKNTKLVWENIKK